MRADRAESTCKALELERKSVLANYASAMNELRLFQEGNEELYRTRAQLCDDLQICQAENRRVREQFMNMQQGARQHSSNMAEFQRQLNLLSREKLTLQKKLEVAESENKRLKMDLFSAHEHSDRISEQTCNLQRLAVEAQGKVGSLQNTLSNVEDERNALRSALLEEKKRYEGIESLLVSVRANEAAAVNQLQASVKENASVKTVLNEAKLELKIMKAEPTSSKTITNVTLSPRSLPSFSGLSSGDAAPLGLAAYLRNVCTDIESAKGTHKQLHN